MPGLVAFELYAQVAQQLEGRNYADWMNDGRGYFFLGPRHPEGQGSWTHTSR
jgi:hypothetical protein